MVIVSKSAVMDNLPGLVNSSGTNTSPVVVLRKLRIKERISSAAVTDNLLPLTKSSRTNTAPVVVLRKLRIKESITSSAVTDNLLPLTNSTGINMSPVVNLYKADMFQEVTPASQSIRKVMPKELGRPQKNFFMSTPMAAKNEQDRIIKRGLSRKLLTEKKLMQEESFDELVPKRARRELLQKSEVVARDEEMSFTLSLLSDNSKVLSTKSKSAVSLECASESDSTDEEDGSTFSQAGLPQLSEYEKKRLKNIKENAKFFASLNMLETAASLRRSATRKCSSLPREKKIKPDQEVVSRRSMRLQRLDPKGIPLPDLPVKPEADHISGNAYVMKPAGPLQMVLVNEEQDAAFHDFLKGWDNTVSKVKKPTNRRQADNLDRYKAILSCMRIEEGYVSKVVKSRIFSMAIHPSETLLLIAAGDIHGEVGIWNLSQAHDPSDGSFLFEPHDHPVCCMHFSPTNPSQLLSVSYDGTLRCGDFNKAIFDEIYRTDFSLSCFDFLGQDGSSLVVSRTNGGLAIVDMRSPGTSHEMFCTVKTGILRTVHVHPEDRNYLLGCGGRYANIYDVRQMTKKNVPNPVASLMGHSKSISSAYFSPTTGKRVVTTCYDDRLRVYDTSCILPEVDLLASIRHNNYTGRWLTSFKAVWDPKKEDCFVVGSMVHPRQIEVFHESGSLLHAFFNMDYLASVCSINVMHPTRNVLAGGNSSGRVHVFMD